ncbi:ATP-binding protein [Alicyclobacillus acidocaldarius]|uniref:ATP-binding protein n=1 Tax=Alicyclobacillus acidocaldarius TaxID=405212 RepID=UPI000860E89F
MNKLGGAGRNLPAAPRYALNSTCVASQLPIEAWYDTFADPTVADAVLDRLAKCSQALVEKAITKELIEGRRN